VRPLEQGLRIKSLMYEASVPMTKIAELCGISKSGAVNLVNRNLWPQKISRDELTTRVETFLLGKGISREQLAGAWEWPEELSEKDVKKLNGSNGIEQNKLKMMEARMIDQACLKHFGLQNDPFPQVIGGPDEMYWSPTYKRTFDMIVDAIMKKKFFCVFGESGCGKTTLRLMVEDHLKRTSNNRVAFIHPHDAQREDMRPHGLAEAVFRDLTPGARSVPQRRETLYDAAAKALRDCARRGVVPVLEIEEAHALRTESLKSLKRLSEINGAFESALAIVLWAQPEILSQRLTEDNWELREVTLRCYMVPVPGVYKDLEAYLAHKIERAGGKLERVFTPDAVKAIKKKIKPDAHAPLIDTPLRVHAIASNAMMRAVESSAPEARVSAELVNSVVSHWCVY